MLNTLKTSPGKSSQTNNSRAAIPSDSTETYRSSPSTDLQHLWSKGGDEKLREQYGQELQQNKFTIRKLLRSLGYSSEIIQTLILSSQNTLLPQNIWRYHGVLGDITLTGIQ